MDQSPTHICCLNEVQEWAIWLMLKTIGVADKWQTLISGLIALLAALIAYRAVAKQIQAAEALEEEKRRREAEAALALLPLALSDLTKYATDCIELLKPYVRTSISASGAEGIQVLPRLAIPVVPAHIISSIQSPIRYLSDDTSKFLIDLLRTVQIQQARIQDLIARLANERINELVRNQIVMQVLDAANVIAKINSLFRKARGEDFKYNYAPADELKNALGVARISEDEYLVVYKLLEQRYNPTLPPIMAA